MEPKRSDRTDRRIRKTKNQLLQGLMTLMQEKDIKDISVKELSDLADINRGTFYLHYRDVYDMLAQVEDSVFQEFNEILDKNFAPQKETALYQVLMDIFTFLDHNRLIARTPAGASRGSGLRQPDEGDRPPAPSAAAGRKRAAGRGF